MPELSIAYFGDIVGSPGRRAVASAIPRLKASHNVSVFIANAENAKNGSGLSPENYRELRRAGLHAMTLGDHVFKDRHIIDHLRDFHEPVSRPANLAANAPGKRIIRVTAGLTDAPPIYVLCVLGRMYMPLPSDNPFACIDRELASIPDPAAIVLVEVHGEVTSEKQAIAWHCAQRWSAPDAAKVVAVVGSHTHVQTADPRILDQTLAAITDLGMCGPHRSVIGRSIDATIDAMSNQAPTPLDVAEDDNRASGVVVTIDLASRRATAIHAFSLPISG